MPACWYVIFTFTKVNSRQRGFVTRESVKHLVILAHPREGSFTRRVAATYVETVRSLGQQVVLRDLYAMGFNPIASADDIAAMRTGRIAEDVQIEMAHVRDADVITFIAPVWWISMPAIMKGWIDRVLVFGFAYGYGPDKRVTGLLPGKRGMVFTSSGSTTQEFLDTGKLAAIRTMWGIGTVEFCAIRLLDHLHSAPVGSRSTPEQIDACLADVRRAVLAHFAG
jgi:NAD(P)H dehydrogenase (quinone)